MEPMFDSFIDQFYMSPTGLPVNGPIYLAKENNVTSEQTFLLSIQVTDSAPSGTNIQPATLDADYRIATPGQTSVTLTFLATPLNKGLLFSSPYSLILYLKELKLFGLVYLPRILE